MFKWARYSAGGYEVSSKGDKRFSAFYARLKNGRTIEEAYQLDVKGYRRHGGSIKMGKGKPPLDPSINLWEEYLKLWAKWADENDRLMQELWHLAKAHNNTLTDMYASTQVNQARALVWLLNRRS